MKFRLLNGSFYRNVLLCSSLFLGKAITSDAQMVDGNVFLRGRFVEVGIAPIGAFGSTTDVPEGYHPGRAVGNFVGFISDPDMDGWDVGTPDYVGCYFLPGDPQEGWDVQIDGTWNRAWRGAMGSGGGGTGFAFTGSPLWLDGENTDYYTDGPLKVGVWEGTMGETDNLAIKQVTSLDTNKVYFIVNVTLKNTGTTPLDNVYYNRTVDADQGSSTPGGAGSITTNTIEYQPDATATTEDAMRCLVSAVDPNLGNVAYLGLGTVDCRAKCYIVGSGLNPSPGAGADLGNIYDETVPDVWGSPYVFEKDATVTNDIGIGLVFNIGTIMPGDSTTLAYAYILREADLDSAFNSLTPSWLLDGEQFSSGDTMRKCWNTDIDVTVKGGGAYDWSEWVDLNGGPSLPAGRNNTVHVEHSVLTYRVVGTSPICPLSDTLIMTFIPEGDSVVLNESICQGETFNFMGNLKYQTGTYVNARKTYIGCDSIVVLNLTVNPLPDVTISARETQICEGEEALFRLDNPSAGTSYQWKRDGANITGATQHTYAAPAVAGVYSVSGVTSHGCTDDSRTITITVNPKAEGSIVNISEQDVCIGDTVTLTSDAKPGYQYTWSPESYFRYTSGNMNTSASAVIPGTSEVYLVSMNEYGCKDYDTAVVTAHPCCDIYIPTAFSPNTDGLNDEFAPKLRPGQKIIALQVFNRKGQLVYDNNSPQKGWNGKFNNTGAEAAQDVYMYRFVYTCTDGEVFETKGDLTLIR